MLWKLIRSHLGPYAGAVTAVVVLQLVATITSLYLPSLNGQIIDEGVAKGDTGFILRAGAIMLGVSLVNIVATVGVARNAAATSASVARDLRSEVFERVGTFSAQEVSRFGAPTLISRNTNDVQQVQIVLNMGLMFMSSIPVMMIGGIIMALREDVGLSWLVAVAVPLLGVIVGSIVWRMLPWFRRMQESVDTVNRILREQITGIRVVRAFVRERFEEARFDEANRTYTGTALAVGRLFALVFPLVMLVFNAASVAVLWFGAHRVDAGEMQVGALTAFMTYLMQILMSVMFGVMMSMMIPRAAVSAGRIGEVLETESSVHGPAQPVALPSGAPTVEFRSVDFTYPGAEQPILSDVSLVARPGEVTAIIGSTGSGKTTLIDLVPRLYDVTDGALCIGGTDIRDLALGDLWSLIGLVPQKPFLFSGTVASNLRYGDPGATDEQLWEALRVAQAADFVEAMDGGLEASISQGGTNVSGGQRQRLAIARALVRRPRIYLFDDSFSALDVATDARLRSALRPWTAESVVIVVAQRVTSIMEADQIVVLEDGRIVGTGRHEELLVTCPTYAEIVQSQALQEDAA
ncbi:MAG: ABC transporter ATP-binding protein/permease [Actinobacteria bacterium]|jgi:ATP-binding cassette subfamily B protein|nr:ABC transporter ATP-binding protein/permease [Actinomycetota bacterium]